MIFGFKEDHPESLAFLAPRLAVSKQGTLSKHGKHDMKRNLVVIPFEDQCSFGSQNAPALFEAALQKGKRVAFWKNPVALAHVRAFARVFQMRRIENDQREAFVFEGQVGHIHLHVRMHLKDASVALDVAFVPNVTVKHVGSRLVEVELAAAAARVENGGGEKLGSFVIGIKQDSFGKVFCLVVLVRNKCLVDLTNSFVEAF